MKKNKRIVFAASECQPFFTSGGLGEVVGSLPKRIIELTNKEYQVDVYLPFYAKINKNYSSIIKFVDSIEVNLSWRRQYCGIFNCQLDGVNYYFIDNEYYFKRDNFYGYFDDAERFAFFSKAVIEVMLKLKRVPNIIHCHDWQTGMIPVYLRTHYYYKNEFKSLKRIFTIHNIEYQGIYSQQNNFIEDVFGIDRNDTYLLEFNNNLNIMKGAIETSNIVSTVSPSYAEEITTAEYAHGLESIILKAKQEGKLCGILNGIDYDFYNPLTDKELVKNYDVNSIDAKKECKKALLEEIGFKETDAPLIGMVTRLVAHKGLEILKNAAEELLKNDIRMVILGTGDPYYEDYFKNLETKYPDKIKTILAFNQGLARRIYSGCDMFLMPSASEPCGLSQMIASRYGTIPLVRETGGLKDSIHDFKNENGNGYSFKGMEPNKLVEMVKTAIKDYQDRDWNNKIIKVMNVDFSWNNSCKDYLAMYNSILNKK